MVLSIVALTVYALLRRFRPAKEVMALPSQQRAVPPDLVTDLVNPRRVRDPAVGYAPVLTAPLRPAPVRMRRPLVAARLLGRVILDSVRSNVAVLTAVLSRRALHSGFVRVPLDVRDPSALAVLAMIVTATPGTAWAELAHDRRALLLHVLSLEDGAAVVATIKQRYERPLMEIFE